MIEDWGNQMSCIFIPHPTDWSNVPRFVFKIGPLTKDASNDCEESRGDRHDKDAFAVNHICDLLLFFFLSAKANGINLHCRDRN